MCALICFLCPKSVSHNTSSLGKNGDTRLQSFSRTLEGNLMGFTASPLLKKKKIENHLGERQVTQMLLRLVCFSGFCECFGPSPPHHLTPPPAAPSV